MTKFEVGKPHPNPETVLGAPSAGWHHGGGMQILVGEPGMTPQQAATYWADARLWLVGSGPLVVLVAKMANGFEYEMPNALLAGRDGFPGWAREELTASSRQGVQIVTVDCQTALVAGLKLATVSPHFTKALHREIRDRWTQPLSEQEFAAAIARHQERYPTIKSMLKDAVASTHLGD